MSIRRNIAGRRQKGMAMVMVLGVLAVVMLMVVHVMTVCEVISKEAYVNATRMELRYAAESASDHGFWMHLTDRRLYSNRKLGQDDESRVSETDFEPWMADRRAHEPFEDANLQVYIDGVEKSIILTKTETFKKNVDIDDTDALDIIDDFLDVLGDYTDTDSLIKVAGKEKDDYSAEGYSSMPRNGAIQFKEEVYWIDGWQDVVGGEVTIVPPYGKSLPTSSGKPSFFSSSLAEIKATLDLSDSEIDEVKEAREHWINESTPIADSLSADLYANILANYNFQESDIAEIVVSSATPNGELRTVFRNTREVNMNKSTIFADKSSQAFSIWSRTIF